MAKEVDLKKVELKVHITCCEGCKRKVKKQLQSIEGVLKVEIDSLLPKVTVLGNVDPKLLVKRLLKIGKHAEICSSAGKQMPEKDKKEAAEVGVVNYGKEKGIDGDDGAKRGNCSDKGQCLVPDKIKEMIVDGSKRDDQGSKKNEKPGQDDGAQVEVAKNTVPSIPSKSSDNSHAMDRNCIQPGIPLDTSNIKNVTQPQYCYVGEPASTVSIQSYSTAAAPLSYAVPPVYVGYYFYENPKPQLQLQISQPPVARVGDYFSDENTIGCHVM